MRDGYLDLCMQSHCAGWALEDNEGARLGLYVNLNKVAEFGCTIPRPELAEFGLPVACGFHHIFEAPLGVDDVVEVRYLDGAPLKGSPSRRHAERLKRLLTGVDTSQRGLEIGALDHPTLGKGNYDVKFVDHASRSDLMLKYSSAGDSQLVSVTSIVDIDYVWNTGLLVNVCGDGYDFCIASHVLEHIGNPIGWLVNVANVLTVGGHLNLAVPDKRRTFDHRRALTQPSQMLEAWMRDVSQPTFGQVFDHIVGVCPFGSPPPDPNAAITEAFRVACEIERTRQYADVHCHVWDFDSFLRCWDVIDQVGIVPLKLKAAYPPEADGVEFVIVFTRI